MTPPPVDAVTPSPEHAIVTTVTGLIVLGILSYCLVTWRRRGTPLYPVMLGGGALSVINEVPLSYAGHFYYPEPDAWQAFEAYGRVIPWWCVFAYTIYVGGLSIAMSEWLDRGITRARVWAGVGVVCLLNVLLEVTVLRTENYFYYGEQPLRIDNFPSIWMAMNVVAVLGSCFLYRMLPQVFTGRRLLLLLPAMPLAQLAGDWVGTPHFLMLNAGVDDLKMTIGSLVGIGCCALVIDAMAKALARQAASVARSLADPVEHSDEVGPVLAGRAR
jgi:hypothetical protein